MPATIDAAAPAPAAEFEGLAVAWCSWCLAPVLELSPRCPRCRIPRPPAGWLNRAAAVALDSKLGAPFRLRTNGGEF